MYYTFIYFKNKLILYILLNNNIKKKIFLKNIKLVIINYLKMSIIYTILNIK